MKLLPKRAELQVGQEALARQALLDSLRNALAAGLLGASVGAGVRTMVGAPYLFGRDRPDPTRSVVPTPLQLPVPKRVLRKKPGEEEELDKAAGWAGDMWSKATDTGNLPHHNALMVLASIGGVGGGYALANHLLNRKRKTDLAAEVEAAKQDYERALLSNFAQPKTQLKLASAPDGTPEALARDLDKLASMARVEALTPEGAIKAATAVGTLLNWYGAPAMALMLGTGYAAYKYTRDRSSDKLLQEALKRRERERFAKHPPEVTAVPAGRLEEEEEPIAPLPR